ncbi:MAG: FliH/SctL family protein [Lachnospiraceae bacterium]
MSNNLLKGGYVVLDKTEKVLIDNNEAVEKILSELASRMQEEETTEELQDGFVEGIDAMQVARLVEDEEEPNSSEVIEDLAKMKEEAQAEIDQMKAQAAKEAEQLRMQASEQGYQDGFAQGQQKAEEECRAHYQELERQLRQEEQNLKKQYQEQMEELEPALVDKLTGIYEHVLGIRLEEEKENILFLINRALGTLDSGSHYILHVSKEDYGTVKENKQMISLETGMPEEAFEIIADATMKKGDCMIESDLGIMDCGLGTQMELLKRQLKLLSYHE